MRGLARRTTPIRPFACEGDSEASGIPKHPPFSHRLLKSGKPRELGSIKLEVETQAPTWPMKSTDLRRRLAAWSEARGLAPGDVCFVEVDRAREHAAWAARLAPAP